MKTDSPARRQRSGRHLDAPLSRICIEDTFRVSRGLIHTSQMLIILSSVSSGSLVGVYSCDR